MKLNLINEKDVGTDGKVVIKIKHLKVWTPEEKSWWRRRITKPKTIILNNVTGCIKEGDFVAVLGPSGAGKTTFLVSLAGKCSLPSSGVVTIKDRNVKELQDVAEIVPQAEVFMDSLTVQEHLVFMTEMKLGSCKKSSNRIMMDTLIEKLQLKAHAHTHVGTLSGGERRLLSLATSLLPSPKILICDEPTTGLDSYNAALVVSVLKNIALSDTTVICSVHQPSSNMFNEFSSIMLMAEGRLLFHGTQDECKNLFDSMNLYCPKNYNPAEYYIRVVSSNENTNNMVTTMEIHRDHSTHTHETSSQTMTTTRLQIYQRNWFKQVELLLWRSSLAVMRDIRKNLIQLIICMTMSSIVIATCYMGISGATQRGVQDLRGFLWLVSSEVMYSLAYIALYAFEGELSLFRREVGIYRPSAYFIATFLSAIPRCIVWPISFVTIATLAVELPNYFITAVEFVVVLMVSSVASTAYGLGMGALFTSTGVMGDVMPCADLPLFLMSGAFLRISSLPVWMYPVKYVSHFYYTMDAMSNIYWRQIDVIDCPSNATENCVHDGVSVLIENGYSKDFILLDSVGLLFVTVIWCSLGYYGLKREEKKGYTY